MDKNIVISKKTAHRGDDGHKVISIRMKDETLEKLEVLSIKTNRSRNELINILVEKAIEMVVINE